MKLTNRERRDAIQTFYLKHPANGLVETTTHKLADLSFEEFCTYLGISITEDQRIISELIETRKQTVVVSSHGIGKCVGENEIITLSNGKEVEAKTLVNTKFKLRTIVNNSIQEVNAIAEFNAIENCYKITSEFGKTIIRNSEHPLYCAIRDANDRIRLKQWLTIEEILNLKNRGFDVLVAMTKQLPSFGDLDCDVDLIDEIPQIVFELNRTSLSKFLYKIIHWCEDVVYSSTNKNNLAIVQRLLLRYGVNSRINDDNLYIVEDKQKWRQFDSPYNTRWESIESIEYIDEKIQTVAICVPFHHTYLTTYYEHNSMISACQILYTVIVRKGLGIVTAPTARQVKSIIFSEINRNFQKLKNNKEFQRKYGINLEDKFNIGHTFIRELETKEKEETRLKFWYEPVAIQDDFDDNEYEGLGHAFGFTSKHNDSNAFQGLHYSGFMLIIADEACGISFEIMEAIEACATGIDNHILLIGNPIARGNPFEKAAKDQGCFRVTCFSHPNVAPYYEERGKDNWVLVDDSCLSPSYKPVINGAVTPQWIEESREKYGTSSLFWYTRVLAKFPRLGHGAGSLIPVEFVESTCEYLELSENDTSQFNLSPLKVGVDVGESSDPTVIAISQEISLDGRNIKIVRGIFQLDTNGDGMQAERNYEFVVHIISHFLNSTFLTESSVIVSVDNTGLGVSLTRDLLKNHKYQVNPVHFAASAKNSKTFLNIRAEMAWQLRESFLNKNIRFYSSVLDTHINQLKYEISGISYEQESKSEKIKLIPKDDIKSILGCSPNVFDAICLLVESSKYEAS